MCPKYSTGTDAKSFNQFHQQEAQLRLEGEKREEEEDTLCPRVHKGGLGKGKKLNSKI